MVQSPNHHQAAQDVSPPADFGRYVATSCAKGKTACTRLSVAVPRRCARPARSGKSAFWRQIPDRAGIAACCGNHDLRHTFASLLVSGGASLE